MRFNAEHGLVVVPARVVGPGGSLGLLLAVDTGATSTMIDTGMLISIGYDPAAVTERAAITTASGIGYAARLVLAEFVALGQKRRDFPVLCHTLPPTAGIDGVVELDFLRGRKLTLDFVRGWITLR